jgi:hypothetical protein
VKHYMTSVGTFGALMSRSQLRLSSNFFGWWRDMFVFDRTLPPSESRGFRHVPDYIS